MDNRNYMINELIDTKADIKSAIESKGVTVTGGLSTYADAIRSIDVSELNIDWSLLGYDKTEIDIIKEAMQKRLNQEIGIEKKLNNYIQDKITNNGISDSFQPFRDKNTGVACCVMFPALYDTKQYTNWRNNAGWFGFFGNCQYMMCVPQYDTSNITYMGGAFNYCNSITVMPKLNLSKCANVSYMFSSCESLIELPEYDFSSVEETSYMLYDSTNLTTVGGFINLGKKKNCNVSNICLHNCDKLTKHSLLNILNGLYDRATAGYSALTIKFHANTFSLLTDTDIATATNKGWIITS